LNDKRLVLVDVVPLSCNSLNEYIILTHYAVSVSHIQIPPSLEEEINHESLSKRSTE